MKIGLQAWGSEGDISPFLALSSGLVRAGHIVTLVVTDNIGRDYSKQANEGGFKLISVPVPPPQDGIDIETIWRQIIEIGNPLLQVELVLKYGYDPVAEAMFDAAKILVAESDVVVGHFFAYPLQIAAELANKPSATLAIVHNCVPTKAWQAPGLPDLGMWSHYWGWKLSRSIVNRFFLPRYNQQRTRAGLSPVKDTMNDAWASHRLNLLAVSPSICIRPSDWESNHVITGFINDTKPEIEHPIPGPLLEFLDAGAPPVFIGFGSMMLEGAEDFARETIDIWQHAVTTLGIRAVFQLPNALLHLVKTADNIHAVAWADYRILFPRCSVIVHHGGAGTTQSALRAGRPTIIVAHVSDQFFWGKELERLGVAGKTLNRKNLKPAELIDSINKVLKQPTLAENSKKLGELMSKENGVNSAIEAIELLLSSTKQ